MNGGEFSSEYFFILLLFCCLRRSFIPAVNRNKTT
jgi:hypothetical protein